MAVSAVAFPAALLSPVGRRADALVLLGCGGRELGWPVLAVPAQWQRHGRGGGMLRNGRMLEQAITTAKAASTAEQLVKVGVIAFPGGAGTAGIVRLARSAAAGGWVGLAQVRG